MRRAIDATKIAALASVALLCVSLAILGLRAARAAQVAGVALSGLSRTVTMLNDPKAGTIQLLDEDLVRIRDLTTHIDQTAYAAHQASEAELAYLQTWNAEISLTMKHANGVLVAARETTEGLNQSQAVIASQTVASLAAVQQTLNGLRPVTAHADATITALDQILSDGNIQRTIANVRITTGNLAAISTDGRRVVDKYTHPSKKRLGFWGGVWAAVEFAHKLEPPIF